MATGKAGTDLHFSDDERRVLKDLARCSIEEVLFGKEEQAPDIPRTLKKKMGAFVCLKTRGELKGCIGYLRAHAPLDETVKRMAVEAAFHDPRFLPLDAREWRDTEIEISVLTPMKKISDLGEIEVGVHGIYIESGPCSGLLLPQVATEYGWDRQTFLDHTCLKAGLARDAWRSKGTNIYIFSADVF
ncbi:MAG: AmmeMemoRadiSam system protein A [Syntrophorhabdales bacterium]